MGARLHSLWQQIKKHPYATGIIVFLVLMLFIFSAYRFGWDWTGFNSGTSQITITNTSKANYTATVSQSSKSLWDWLQLLGVLAIPIVVGLGAAWYTAQQGKVSDREKTDNQRETALQAYIDKISELLLHEKLHESTPPIEARVIAQARTVTVLRILDPVRRGSLIRFLSEANILAICAEDALVGIDLQGANLTKVKLGTINLKKANLTFANLQGAGLTDVKLQGANLSGADLSGAGLTDVNLQGADLSRANLKGTAFTDVTMSDETKHP